MPQVGVKFLAVGLGRFHQAVELRAGGRALGRVAEQPVLAPMTKGRMARSAGLLTIGR